MRTLPERLADVPQTGRVVFIGVRPARGAPLKSLTEADLLEGRGLAGDTAAASAPGVSKRQVTLLQAEHLPVIAALTGQASVAPLLLRRNLVVAGINLLSLRLLRFHLGDALLEGTGPCAPCAKMEAALGRGGFQAMRGHGGITARVLRGGRVLLGAQVRAAVEA
jgi:MOSC domain-containing protein YiiM